MTNLIHKYLWVRVSSPHWIDPLLSVDFYTSLIILLKIKLKSWYLSNPHLPSFMRELERLEGCIRTWRAWELILERTFSEVGPDLLLLFFWPPGEGMEGFLFSDPGTCPSSVSFLVIRSISRISWRSRRDEEKRRSVYSEPRSRVSRPSSIPRSNIIRKDWKCPDVLAIYSTRYQELIFILILIISPTTSNNILLWSARFGKYKSKNKKIFWRQGDSTEQRTRGSWFSDSP